MDATGMACVDEAKPKRKTMGMSFFILVLPNKRAGASCTTISNQLSRTCHCPNGSCAYPIVEHHYDLVEASAAFPCAQSDRSVALAIGSVTPLARRDLF
jgi:hypothetical protein